MTGSRPSAFFEWNDEDEWFERLSLDLYVVGIYLAEKNKQMKV